MAKKNFKLENPAMQFIDLLEEVKDEAEIKPVVPAPDGYKINTLYIEKKTRHLQLLMKSSIYEKLKTKSEREGNSVNDIVNSIIEDALKDD